jgi:hypothetical protein
MVDVYIIGQCPQVSKNMLIAPFLRGAVRKAFFNIFVK